MPLKGKIIRLLLAILNSRFLNQSPCDYGYINNVDSFSYSNLASEEKQRPGITVKTILADADRFKTCPVGRGLQVCEDGEYRDANVWDIHELTNDVARELEGRKG